MNGNHLISESVRGMHEISGFGQQDEILNPLSVAGCAIALHHISESSNWRASKDRGPGVQGVRLAADER